MRLSRSDRAALGDVVGLLYGTLFVGPFSPLSLCNVMLVFWGHVWESARLCILFTILPVVTPASVYPPQKRGVLLGQPFWRRNHMSRAWFRGWHLDSWYLDAGDWFSEETSVRPRCDAHRCVRQGRFLGSMQRGSPSRSYVGRFRLAKRAQLLQSWQARRNRSHML